MIHPTVAVSPFVFPIGKQGGIIVYTQRIPVVLERLDAKSVTGLQEERDSQTSTVWRRDHVQSFLVGLHASSAYGHLLSHAEILAAENAILRKQVSTIVPDNSKAISPDKLSSISFDRHWICFMPDAEPPRYKHDCKSCQFLGLLFKGRNSFVADIYLCGHTVIFRVSDDDPDYWSMDFMGVNGLRFFTGESSTFHKVGFALYCAAYLP